jgi:hypothetical protein
VPGPIRLRNQAERGESGTARLIYDRTMHSDRTNPVSVVKNSERIEGHLQFPTAMFREDTLKKQSCFHRHIVQDGKVV